MCLRNHVQQFGIDLALVERMLRRLRAGEVAHQQSDAVIFRADARRQRGGLVGGNAEPVHAGVDMQRGAAGKAGRRNEVIPLGELDDARIARRHGARTVRAR